jgi:Txe/YoeB family toxin of Txe-Axe toxin-antitoxin module
MSDNEEDFQIHTTTNAKLKKKADTVVKKTLNTAIKKPERPEKKVAK